MNGYEYNPDGDYNDNFDQYSLYTNKASKSASRAVSRFALALFVYLLVSNIVVILVEVILYLTMGIQNAESFLAENIYMNWLLGVGPMYLIGLPIFYLMIRNMKTFRLPKTKMSFGELFCLFLICEGFMFVGNLVGTHLNTIISGILDKEITNPTAELIEKSPLWLIFLIVVIIGPIIEELMFRKFMIDRIGKYGAGLALVISSVAFGLFHGNFYQFFYATLLGFILGYVYINTRDVKYTVIMHMLVNFLGSFVSIIIMPLLTKLEELSFAITEGQKVNLSEFMTTLMAILSYSLVQYVIWISGIIVFIYYIRNRKFSLKKACDVNVPRGRLLEVSVLNVGSILFILLSLIQFAISIFIA